MIFREFRCAWGAHYLWPAEPWLQDPASARPCPRRGESHESRTQRVWARARAYTRARARVREGGISAGFELTGAKRMSRGCIDQRKPRKGGCRTAVSWGEETSRAAVTSIGLGFADPSAALRALFDRNSTLRCKASLLLGRFGGWKPCLGRGAIEQGFLSFRQGRSITGAGATLLSLGLPGAG